MLAERKTMRKWIAAPLLGCLFLNAIPGQPAEPFAFKDGDRVVLIGNTLIEREQRYGYWELALTRAFPDKNITFRNLGWSGDTVWGDAMAGFGTAADGFKHRKEHVLALKPTVIIIGYGGNEAFDGPGGLKKFEKGLNDLLDSLAPAKARIVLISPPPHEKLGPPLPDPAEQNKNLGLYRDALREVATQRKLDFFDLYKEWSQVAPPDNKFPLTDDGIHLSSWGYGVTAGLLPTKAAEKSKEWRIDVGTKERTLETSRTKATWVEGKGVCFRVTDQMVPFPILRTNKSSPPRPIGKGADDKPGTPSVEVVSHALAIQGEMRTFLAVGFAQGSSYAVHRRQADSHGDGRRVGQGSAA